ncbi:MAG: N-acetylmuramoyl-L-alanine amidase [Candidatus Omnitrophica bacterium]|nr:N-acetylmuramoyl-L-alanine amidase [Candidatus Omnitrophota bacterium]
MMNKKFLTGLCVLVLGTLISGCATVPKQPSVSAKKETYLKDICDRNNISWRWDQVSQVVTLRFRGIEAKVLVGSDLVIIGGDRITLSAPTRTVRSTVIVPFDFQSKVVSRLRREAGRGKGYVIPKVRSIIIDAGHGGKDPGAIGRTGLQEKDVVLDICKRLKKILQERGFKIKMTRESDNFISLKERTEIASRANVDLFISIHANSWFTRGVYGFETYSARELGFVDRIATQRKRNESLMFNNLSIKRNALDVERIVSDMLYEHKQAESKLLAKRIGAKTAKLIKAKNRGAKKERFFVLRNTLIPAILVEVGFLSNSKEEKLLKTKAYRRKISESLARSLLDYINGIR